MCACSAQTRQRQPSWLQIILLPLLIHTYESLSKVQCQDASGVRISWEGNAGLQSAWRPLSCPNGIPLAKPSTVEAISALIQEARSRCAPGTLSIRASRPQWHSNTPFTCADVNQVCKLQLDMSAFNQVMWIDKQQGRVAVGTGMLLDKLSKVLHEHGLSLEYERLPIYTGLTVGGLLLSGAHGSSTTKPSSFGHLVEEVAYVDAQGKVRVATNSTNPPALWFTGSLGLFGVVTHLVLRTVPDYKLVISTSLESDTDLIMRIPSLMRDPLVQRVHWFPHAGKVIIKKHILLPAEVAGNARHSFFTSRPQFAIPVWAGLAINQMNPTFLPTDWAICAGYAAYPPLWYKEGPFYLPFNTSAVGFGHDIGGSNCEGSEWGCYWRTMYETLMEMDLDQLGLTYWMQDVKSIFRRFRGCIPDLMGIVMRFGKASSAPMDMASGRDTVYIDLLMSKGVHWMAASHQDVYDEIEQMSLLKHGARAHWGKNTVRTFLDERVPLRYKYPDLPKFLALVKENDLEGIFMPELLSRVLYGERPANLDSTNPLWIAAKAAASMLPASLSNEFLSAPGSSSSVANIPVNI